MNSEDGFGLTESLVAVALLGTAVLSLVMALCTGSLATGATRDGATSQSLAQSQLAYIKSYPFDSGATSYPSVDTYHATYNPSPVTMPGGYSIEVAVSSTQDTDSSIQKITATVLQNGETAFEMEDFKVDR